MSDRKEKRRIDYLDVAKFIGLVLVCFCHIPFPEGNFHVWVYSFHMPLFFIISGIFFSPDKFEVKKSVTQLLVPFVAFNIIACVVSMVIGAVSTGHLKFPNVTPDLVLKSNYIIGPSWFLISLFILRVYCGLVLKYLNSLWLIASALLVMAVFCLTADSGFWYMFSLGSTVLGLPFYLLGYYFKGIFIEEKHIDKWWLPLAALGLSIPALYNGQVGIHVNDFGHNIVLFIVFGIIGSVSIITLSRYVKFPKRIMAVFMDGALFIICFHTLIFEYLILVWNKLTDDFSGNTVIEKMVFTALTFIVSYPLILLMRKYAPFLLGKKPALNRKSNVLVGK